MNKLTPAIALAFVAAGLPSAAGAVTGHYPVGAEEPGAQGRANVAYALGQIPTAAHTSALQRMRACGFDIQWKMSWVARQRTDIPAYGTHAGDLTVQVVFDRKTKDPKLGQALLARWFIQNGRAVPNSGWAKLIQTAPDPMPLDPPAHC